METAYDYSSSKQTLYFVNIRAKSWIETVLDSANNGGLGLEWRDERTGDNGDGEKNKFQEQRRLWREGENGGENHHNRRRTNTETCVVKMPLLLHFSPRHGLFISRRTDPNGGSF